MDYQQRRIYFLKCNIASLSFESRNLKREIRKAPPGGTLRPGLQSHLDWKVKPACRAAFLAYAALRGVPYERVEQTCRIEPDWRAVRAKAEKFVVYGSGKAEEVESWIEQAMKYLRSGKESASAATAAA